MFIYNKTATIIFNLGMESTIELAVDGIKNKAWDFNALMTFSAFRRGKIAEWQGHKNASLFGSPRSPLTIKRNLAYENKKPNVS